MGDRTLQSVIATARTALRICSMIQGSNSIDLIIPEGKCRSRIYVCNPLKDLIQLKPLLFVQHLFNHS